MESLGFKSGRVKLPGILLEVELPPDCYFRNDGVKEDFDEHSRRVLSEFTSAPEEHIIESGDAIGINVRGRHEGFNIKENGNTSKYSVVYIRDSGDIRNLQILGHEATHAAMFLDNDEKSLEKQILQNLKDNGFEINPFKKYSNPEDICNSIGLFGVYKLKGTPVLTGLDRHSVYFHNGLMMIKDYSPLIKDLMESRRE